MTDDEIAEYESLIEELVAGLRAGVSYTTLSDKRKPQPSIADQILAEAMRRRLKQRLAEGDI